ncbi:MAG: ribonuclease Z [Roseiflexaceae bacterium]
MRITFLGTGAGAPTRTRNVSSIALQFVQQGRLWLFDCGEGTQQQLLRTPLRLSQLERIFLTHLHGDHLFGMPGLLASRSLQTDRTTPVTVYGPPGVADYVQCALTASQTWLNYPLHVETVEPGVVYTDATVQVVATPLRHGIATFGYAVVEHDQVGRFQVEQAQALGIPPGPLYGRLKRGETITLPDGRTVQGANLVGPRRLGRKVVYCADTSPEPAAVALAREADVLIHEATFLEEDLARAERALHTTAAQAAGIAQQAGVKQLILTHISPRYEATGSSRLEALLAEAQAIFSNTLLAYDLWTYDVPPRAVESDAPTTGSGQA